MRISRRLLGNFQIKVDADTVSTIWLEEIIRNKYPLKQV